MKCTDTQRETVATAHGTQKGDSVVLCIEREGVQAETFRMSVDEARELAERLLKASGIKFTLKF